MHAKLSLLAGVLCLGACATHRDAPEPIIARIAAGEEMHLPAPPGYPETRSFAQSIRATYGQRNGAFEALVSLAPERVDIVITALSGPRLATISWTAQGVDVDRTLLAPAGLPVENILSDIFVMNWPSQAVEAAAPPGCAVVDAGGGRTLACNGQPIIEISPDTDNPQRKILRNRALGYELTITSME